jgi:hypothetical protein
MIVQAHPTADRVLTRRQGFGVFCAWTAILLAAACCAGAATSKRAWPHV